MAPLLILLDRQDTTSPGMGESAIMRPNIVRPGEGQQQTVLGDQQIVKLNGKDTNGQFLLIEQNTLPGVGIPRHVHTHEDEVFHVVHGLLKVLINDQEHVLEAGGTAFCPRGVPHSWEVVGETRATVLLMNFPAGLENMLSQLAELGNAPKPEDISAICRNFGIEFV